MSYKRLYYFFILGCEKNYSEAAKKIGIKQPTLSQQINLLEEELNIRLFYRNSRKVLLTTAGEQLFRKISEMKKELDDAVDELWHENSSRKVLRIGVMQGELTDLISNVMIRFKMNYPDVQCVLYTLDLSTSMVEKGELDLYFDYDTTDNKNNMKFLYEDGFNIISSKDVGNIDLEILSNYSWVLMNDRYSCRHIFEELSSRYGFNVRPAIELSDLSVVYNMVNNNMGISLVSDTSLSFYDSETLNILKMKESELKRNVVMHHNGGLKAEGFHNAFYQLTIQELKKLKIIR